MESVSSIVEADVYELVWRQFKRTRIYEVLLRIWKSDLKTWEDSINKGRSLFPTAKTTTWQGLVIDPVFGDRSYSPLHLGGSPHYYEPRNNHFFYQGFPLPEQGGILYQWGDESRIRVFMDDQFLCPDCGGFHPFQRYWPDIPWLDEMERRTNVDALFEAIEQRRNSKQFGHRPCEDRKFCEKTAASFREEFERKEMAERERLERLAWAAKVKEIVERPVTLPTVLAPTLEQKQNAHVYLIGNNGFVKIGIATNVKKRLSSLQTSSPFPLQLIKSWQCGDAFGMEKRLHRRFAKFRHKGEWFRLSERTINRLLAVDELDAYLKRKSNSVSRS